MDLLRICLMFKTSLSLKKGFKNNFFLISMRIEMIEVLIQNLNRGGMLIHQKRDQLVVSAVRSMEASAF